MLYVYQNMDGAWNRLLCHIELHVTFFPSCCDLFVSATNNETSIQQANNHHILPQKPGRSLTHSPTCFIFLCSFTLVLLSSWVVCARLLRHSNTHSLFRHSLLKHLSTKLSTPGSLILKLLLLVTLIDPSSSHSQSPKEANTAQQAFIQAFLYFTQTLT